MKKISNNLTTVHRINKTSITVKQDVIDSGIIHCDIILVEPKWLVDKIRNGMSEYTINLAFE